MSYIKMYFKHNDFEPICFNPLFFVILREYQFNYVSLLVNLMI